MKECKDCKWVENDDCYDYVGACRLKDKWEAKSCRDCKHSFYHNGHGNLCQITGCMSGRESFKLYIPGVKTPGKGEMKMTKEEALKKSIKKWKKVRDGAEEHGGDDCALCELYLGQNCMGCPVSGKTGKMGCEGTPFQRWQEEHVSLETVKRVACTRTLVRIAQDMVGFLESLEDVKVMRGDLLKFSGSIYVLAAINNDEHMLIRPTVGTYYGQYFWPSPVSLSKIIADTGENFVKIPGQFVYTEAK